VLQAYRASCAQIRSLKIYIFFHEYAFEVIFVDADLLRQPFYLIDIRSFDVGFGLALDLILLVEQSLRG